jgi:multimeric flavodoxin WrbA
MPTFGPAAINACWTGRGLWLKLCSYVPMEKSESMKTKVTAIMGTYRKGGTIDSATDAILAGAADSGAEVSKIYLLDRHIEFCRNCRTCTQKEGPQRGACPIKDEMPDILDELERSDAIVLGSPMNVGTVTALMKRFMERLVCRYYWPWGLGAPKLRNEVRSKRAVLVASSAAPALMARMQSKIIPLMNKRAGALGARKTGVLFIGLAAMEKHMRLSDRTIQKAHRLGRKLVTG